MENRIINKIDDKNKLEYIEIYEKVLKKEIIKFPRGFWGQLTEEEGKAMGELFIKYILKNKYNIQDLLREKKKVETIISAEDFFNKYRLNSIYFKFFKDTYSVLDYLYPGNINIWEYKNIKKQYWKDNKIDRKKAIDWLLKETKKKKLEDLLQKEFSENKLLSLYKYLCEENIYISRPNRTERKLKIIFNDNNANKGQQEKTAARLTIPVTWLRKMEITEEQPSVIAKFENNQIIIIPSKS